MKKGILNVLIMIIVLSIIMSLSTVSNATEISETEKSKILEFIEDNAVLSYYNYDKVENIYITRELLCEVGGKRVTSEQRKNSEIYEMVEDLDEGFVSTRDEINTYLQNTIGITVDKLKNYEQLLNQATTSDNKNQFYYFVITGPTHYSDYTITKTEETSNGTIKVTITAKADEQLFSNVIELVKKGDSYNFVSSTSADSKSRTFDISSENEFNNKKSNNLEKNKIIKFIEDNAVLSYYNYDKVENIYITRELLCEVGGKRVTSEQRKNSEIYEMVEDLDEGFVSTRDEINTYLQNTIGITVDKLKNYEQLLNQATTSDNKNQFYYFVITGPTHYSDYTITKTEETSNGTIKVTITAKADEQLFSNVIELVKKGDSYNFVSSTSADSKSRTFSINSKNEFNNKGIKNSNSAEEPKKDTTVATTKIPQTGVTENIIIISSIAILSIIVIAVLIKYSKMKNI